MAILTNNLLFNHTYLKELAADTSVDSNIPFSPRDLGDWYNARDASSIQVLVDSWVRPMLSLLELDIHQLTSDDERAFELTTDYDRDTAIGVCYVAPPEADLDTTTKGQFWMAQAVLAARRYEPVLRWVILTNGDLWRLLDAQTLRRYEAYVQIDVGQLARGAEDPSALRVFFRCFHRSAFEQDGDGKNGLEKLLIASEHATEKAEKHLKERVSGTDGIMAQLCLGLVRSTGKSKFNEEERDAIYRDATTLLYRMLFLLYAESRGLLPVENPNYTAVSMQRLVATAREGQERGLDKPQATKLWTGLKRLSNAIYESDPDLDIPAYNGGLFDDDDHPYLRDGFIEDQYLSRALYDLAFLPNGNDIQVIDFRDLSVRHLGSLYEGMIEYKLFVAEESILARRDKKGNIHFLTQREGGGLRRNDHEIKSGEVYFAQSSGERRATGTYYTPEYIVDYIVRNTVVRGLEECRSPLEEKLETWLIEIHTSNPDERFILQRTVDEELLKFVEEQVLTFTVCDPAMGSGHFLVNAAHKFTNFIVETLYMTDWDNDGLDCNPVYWRRRTTDRCLYGVDISEMAVELAKLSLWLVTMAEGKPLSFLKHHLRDGNSLVGARLENLSSIFDGFVSDEVSPSIKKHIDAGQLSWFENPAFASHINTAINVLNKISSRAVDTVSDVKKQESDFDLVLEDLSEIKNLVDLLLANNFGLILEKNDINKIVANLWRGVETSISKYRVVEKAKAIADYYKFFHWELEFPEIFLNQESSQAGFDVIIGNPPYGIIFDDQVKRFIEHKLPSFTRNNDVYIAFAEECIGLIKLTGLYSLIIPNTFIMGPYFNRLKKIWIENTQVIFIDDYGFIPLFPDPNVFSSIFLCRRNALGCTKPTTLRDAFVDSQSISYKAQQCVSLSNLPLERWKPYEPLTVKAMHVGNPLNELCYVKDVGFNYWTKGRKKTRGESIGTRVLYNGKQQNKNDIPYLKGRDFYRYDNPLSKGHWLRHNYIDILNPEIDIFRYSPEYLQVPQKIIYRQTADDIIATIDGRSQLLDKTVHVIVPIDEKCSFSLYYILALLNSRLLSFVYNDFAREEGRTFAQVKTFRIKKLPIQNILFSVDINERKRELEEVIYQYGQFCDDTNPTPILGLVEIYLSQNDKKPDIVHDILSFLALQMVEMNKQKQSRIKEFLEWLESFIGVGLDNLTGKTGLRNFLGDYRSGESHLEYDAMLEILKKNKLKLAFAPSELDFRKSLGKRYQETLDLLLPIKQRLAITDQLIDQIIYRLFELTEDEIAIVEGKA